jgi:hypothetical protein
MNPIATLMRREWLQHRFGWSLLLLLPTAIALLLFSFGQLQFEAAEMNERLPVALALAALAGGVALHFVMLWLTSLIIVSGIARRDHADRSIEFWLSLPTGHAPSLAVPLLVHLLLVPAAALLAGLLSGALVSLVLVTRVSGLGTWFALPWLGLGAAGLAIVARLAVGLVLATLWLSPLILLGVLLTAWFRRWGIVILAVGIGLGSVVLERVFGQPVLTDVLGTLFRNAAFSLKGPDSGSLVIDNVSDIESVLAVVPGWAVEDAGQSLALLPSPLLLGALLVAAACFALLVQWRQRGAGAAG